MACKAATYLAFHSVVRRGLTTSSTLPIRHTPRPQLTFLPPHHTLVSKAARGRKLPKNHFTSNTAQQQDQQTSKLAPIDAAKTSSHSQQAPKTPKRKAAQRTQAPSLRRVAVEAQRSRGSLIKGRGKTRHVDPELETKEITAYCAAETYNVHVARDLLRREGWDVDPLNTGLFPQVLHVRAPDLSAEDGRGWRGRKEEADNGDSEGDIFIFPSGSVVTWNVAEKIGKQLVERVLLPAAGNSHLDRLEAEDLEYLEDPTREDSEILGDTIILGTKPLESHQTSSPSSESASTPEIDTTLAKIAFSSALARSTKLAVLENSLATYFHTTHDIPFLLSRGTKPRFTRAFILRKTGELLSIRAQLNLYSELTDSLPDLFWDSPHELGLESYYDAVGRALDVEVRIRGLNEKMDYASEIAAVLRERLSERHGHLLEWIIILLILIEVAYGSLHLYRERRERLDPDSDKNLMREWLLKELEKENGGKGRVVVVDGR